MPLSWNEIRQNAIRFASDWAGVHSEAAEKQTFWNEFFGVFGVRRRTFASFEEPVKQISGKYGRIDLFWKGMLLVEHKSRGENLGKAESQAFEYIQDLVREGREDEVPRYVVVSDFARFALHDLEPDEPPPLPSPGGPGGKTTEFTLDEFHRSIHEFAFIAGYQQHRFEDQDPINLRAVKIMDDLHDSLEAGGYSGHELERFLVRILFCLFAQCTSIFEREAFRLFIEDRTKPDGSDLGVHLAQLFAVLNTPEDKRQKNLDETLAAFPFVNGDLFAESLGFAAFNRDMRNSLLACTHFDWSQISPAIFGSLFQGTMEAKERRQFGSHYTNERDILKVVRGLFLDDIKAEFERAKSSRNQLKQFHQRLAAMRFLDPACGGGNFLVITYRELRLLEIEILKILEKGQQHLNMQTLSLIDVDAFYGIEIDEWPARIAEVAMWLMDHQMNIRLSETFGQYYVRLPLKKSPTIVLGNALRLDWREILPPEKCDYILGNPPFVGKKARNPAQQADMEDVFGEIRGAGVLDYVCCWYLRAAEYVAGTHVRVAFVSTNSITQGEQPGVLWSLLRNFGIRIHFAHRTFAWESEARGKAHVHVVIVGFAAFDSDDKRIFDYESNGEGATGNRVTNISPYLVEGGNTILASRELPLCAVSRMQFGSMPNDDGNLVLSDAEKRALIENTPECKSLIRPLLSAHEYLHGERRWCLWLKDVPSQVIADLPEVKRRVEAVRDYRLKSARAATKKLAEFPMLFGEIRQPASRFVLVPRHSSENRRYIPMSYFGPNYVPSDSCLFIENATLLHFGILSSAMHMAWVGQVCGRIKSDFRYSAKLVFNNFPCPESPTKKQTDEVEAAAKNLLAVRAEQLKTGATLATLYDPAMMPAALTKAHHTLDRAVDRCYRRQAFMSDRQRVEFLFALYEKIASPLLAKARKKKA